MRGRGVATGCDGVRVRRGGCSALASSLVFVLVVSSCGDSASPSLDSGVDAPLLADAWPGDDAYSGPVPGVVPAACRFHVPDGFGLTEGADYDCGDLVVYEDRDVASGRIIKVHYVRFFSSASSTNATVFLDGGPGASGDGTLAWINDHIGPEFVDGLLVDGDFLVIAQRGTRLSEPALTCDGCTSLDCCSSSLSEIADLPSYNTAYNADDVDDLRSTLGYDQLNLYGISYGSRLGLEVMRRHGDHLRSSVLDSVVPPQVNWLASNPKGLYSAITALDAACAEDGQCATAYGDLVAKVVAGVGSLTDEPLTFHEGFADEVTLDGGDFAGLLFGLLKLDASTYPRLPMVISDVAERRTDRVGETVAAWVVAASSSGGDGSAGLYASVVCGEQFNPPDESAFDEINADVPASLREAFARSWNYFLENCASWPVGAPRSELSQPVTSAVRTLVSSGSMDPITPPSYGDLAATTLSDREVVVFPSSGHISTQSTPCGNQTLFAFLADPEQPVDTSCTESLTIDFELPSKRTPWSAADQARLVSALRRAPIPPPIR